MRLTSAAIALFIALTVLQVKRGANIELTLSGDNVHGNLVECNSNITLMCKAGVPTDTMSWHRNVTKIGDCNFGYCSPTPPVNNNYGFVFDTASGVFNFSAEPVTYAESNADFKCTIGAETKSLMLNVTGDFSIYPSTKKIDSNMTALNISTGCIDKNIVVQFQWRIMNVTNQTDVHNLPESYQKRIVLNSTSCFSDPYCGGTGKEKKISQLSIEEDDSKADVYFLAIIVNYEQYPNKSRQFQFKERPFKIKDTSISTLPSTTRMAITTIPTSTSTSSKTTTTRTEPTTTSPNNTTSHFNNSEPTTLDTTINIITENNNVTVENINNKVEERHDRDVTVLIYVASAVGGVIFVVLFTYVLCLVCRRMKKENLNSAI